MVMVVAHAVTEESVRLDSAAHSATSSDLRRDTVQFGNVLSLSVIRVPQAEGAFVSSAHGRP